MCFQYEFCKIKNIQREKNDFTLILEISGQNLQIIYNSQKNIYVCNHIISLLKKSSIFVWRTFNRFFDSNQIPFFSKNS